MAAEKWRSIVITHPDYYEDEDEAIIRLLEAGLTVHVRKPTWDADRLAALLLKIPPYLHPQMRLHSHFELLDEFPMLGGVHLNSRWPQAPQAARNVSRSCHTLEELADADRYEYVFLSPIFDSISKDGYTSRFDLSTLAPHLRGRRVIALGGVRPQDFRRLQQAGFTGAAVLGYMWQCYDFGDEALHRHMICKHTALLNDFRLQFITHAPDARTTADQALSAVRGGCRWVQVRMKEVPDQCAFAVHYISGLKTSRFMPLIVDDHVALARCFGIGVHLGRGDMSPIEARRQLGEAAIIGATAHSLDEVMEIVRNGVADYIGLGPFRDTTTKRVSAPTLGIEGVRNIIAQVRKMGAQLPIVVIGGIRAEDVPQIMAAGADGVAVSGAIINNDDPVAATQEFIFKLNQCAQRK